MASAFPSTSSLARIGERLVEAQAENLILLQKRSSDQQSLPREVNHVSSQFHEAVP